MKAYRIYDEVAYTWICAPTEKEALSCYQSEYGLDKEDMKHIEIKELNEYEMNQTIFYDDDNGFSTPEEIIKENNKTKIIASTEY